MDKPPPRLTIRSPHHRFGFGRFLRRISQKRPARQAVFAFVERARRRDGAFKIAVAALTLGVAAALLAALPAGRHLADWLGTRCRWLAMRSVGREPSRDEIEAEHRRKRAYDIQTARTKYAEAFASLGAPRQRLLRFGGMDPAHVLLRWGNFDRTVLLPSTVFEADETGRSYRFRPKMRSIWVHRFPALGPVKAYFQIPDRLDVGTALERTGAQIAPGSSQTTNSWGLRGPEPDLSAPWRGIVLGDSYMQGIFVGDDQTPTECLKRDLRRRLGAPVEILNTGHLGYSPEQYYFTLLEYANRFPPQFVVVSLCANDFGDMNDVLSGREVDWADSASWLGRIQQFCTARLCPCLFVPAPWVKQLDGPQMAGFYPGAISNVLKTDSSEYLDPINDFANARLAISLDRLRRGEPVGSDPLFNVALLDGHFSPRGCEVWAEAVGRRVALLVEKHVAEIGSPGSQAQVGPANRPP